MITINGRLTCLLFTPVLKEGWAEKAWGWNPDGVILDLEDSIPENDKRKARARAKAITETSEKTWFLRINSIESGMWEEDLNVALTANISGILIPKVKRPEDVMKVDRFLTESELFHSGFTDTPLLIPIIENALGLENAMKIASASPNIYTLAFGAADFARDMWLWGTPGKKILEHAKFRIAAASRAAGLSSPHDSPYFRIGNNEGLLEEVLEARSLAFGGKHAIHPSQIEIIRDNFRPSNEEIQWAQSVVSEFEEALQKGIAAIKVNNEMVDYPVYGRAKRIAMEYGLSGGSRQ